MNKRTGRKRKSGSFRRLPRTAEELFASSERFQLQHSRILSTISSMRDGMSLEKAAQESHIDPRTVIRLGRSALRKGASGKYAAKPHDQLLRVLVLPFPDGLREVAVRDSRQATVVGEYWAAVQKHLATGNDSALKKIRRKTITDADGKRIRLLKDVTELERLASAGVLSFESLYAKVA